MHIPVLLQLLLSCILGGVLSVGAAALLLFGMPQRWLSYAVSLSTGLLLATATLHLLPNALENGLNSHQAFPVFLAGILAFFLMEKVMLWRHAHGLPASETEHTDAPGHAVSCVDHRHACHHQHRAPECKPGEEGFAILLGNSVHNITDGLLLAAAFLVNPALGWTAALATLAHEVPQEAGDFAILLATGWRRSQALLWSALTSLATAAGGLMGYFMLAQTHTLVPYVLTISASGFLYVAVADLMPRLKREQKNVTVHMAFLAAGIMVSVLMTGHQHAHRFL